MKFLSSILLIFTALLATTARGASPIETSRHYLSGTDKDSDVRWDFMCTSGRNSGKWTKIKVPSCWETQGFGTYYYGWEEPENSSETGHYRHRFRAAKEWRGKSVSIVFEGSMTDTEVRINGKKAGATHEGGFYRFSYDISGLLDYGKANTLEVSVKKCPANPSVYRAERQTDFWLFGGIYRPVYIEVKPTAHIESIAIDARADGSLSVRPYVNGCDNGQVSVYVESIDGKRISDTATGPADSTISLRVPSASPWSHESPTLYRVVAELGEDGRTLHRVSEKTGFRTIEYRESDGFYLNGERIIFKGVNRHCFWPESGRTLSRRISLDDALLIKEMNMNAVRMSHYPPDKEFLEICDSVGLLVIDELCGWQKKYDTPTARRLARAVVERDRNHPSVIMWANGNEGGWNTDADGDYALYDLQKRPVIHPWERFSGTDTKHYPDYNYVVNSSIYDYDIYFPTEFMHGNFDGGAAASLSDFWEAMMKHRAPAGGFLWALLDEGLVRNDHHDSIDCRGSLAPDGIVGPYREKEASFYAIRDIWSPVKIASRKASERLAVENHFMFTDLAQCRFSYRLTDLSMRPDGHFEEKTAYEGTATAPSTKPGECRIIDLGLPSDWHKHDVLHLDVADPDGRAIYTFSAPIDNAGHLQRRLGAASHKQAITLSEDSANVYIRQGECTYTFDKATAMLAGVQTANGTISLCGGPAVATSANTPKGLNHYKSGDSYIVEPQFEEGQWLRWVFSPDEHPRLDYTFSVEGETDYIGIGFDYPEEKTEGMEWIGRGPYRVWKNRMEGMEFGCHSKRYNNTVTGESWDYPEFKGYHADCRAVTVNTAEGDISLIPSRPGLFFQMLTPQRAKADNNAGTYPAAPGTSIGFMHAIPPIGTRFQKPEQLGPAGQKNMQLNWTPISGSIHFIFHSK